MKRIPLILVAALATFNANAADSLTMTDFVYTNKLQVAGYTGTETLQNFPVLVRISTNLGDFQYSRMRSQKGGDLAFFAADGTRLASEVDTWTTSGTSLVWVKLPSMAQGTQFYMCYRLTDELAALDTMVDNPNPWGDYVGVWHLKETGVNKTIADSSPNEMHGYTTVGEGVNESNGAIGQARRIATNNYHAPGIIVDATNGVKNTVADSLGTDFHASFWMRAQGKVSYSYLLGRRRGDNGASWGVQFHEGDPPKQVRIFSGGVLGQNSDNDCTLTATGVGSTLSEKSSNPRTWKKVDVIWKDVTNGNVPAYDFYIDGVLVESKNLKMAVNTNEHANIGIGCSTQDVYANADSAPSGHAEQKGRRLNGDMDEVRLRPGIVSADWIRADYDTVKDEEFVTPAPPEVTWVNDSGITPGVSYVHYDYVAFDGTVTSCGGFSNCLIQCKVWPMGGTEPENWTTLTNGLVAADTFSVAYLGLAPNTAYSYKLRAAGRDGYAESVPVEGNFTTLAGFAVAWSTATESTGLSEIHNDQVVVAGAVATLGETESFEVQWKCWADGAAEPASWTTITNVLGAVAFEVAAGELASGSAYNYALRAVANNGETTTPVIGTFTTLPGLTVVWDETTGIVQVGYDFVKIGGTVIGLGEATACLVQRKIWASGESEPDWTTFETGLVRNDSFTDVVSGLTAGTTYSYKLRAYGNDDETTEVVEGTFTTHGDEGETIGSDYTHFFDDGTNAFWVANDFERYLPFTVTGYTGSETLTNFPVLVEVRAKDTNGFTYDDFYHYDGSDIVFVDEKGHIIPHEIDTWNKSGMSLFWVRLPEMNNGTKFTMCYRSPLLKTPPDPGNTFEPYVGVWHMNETNDGVDYLKDSSPNNLETETHAMSTADNNGRIGYARRVAQTPGSSSSFGRIIAFDHDDILRTGVGNVFTFSGWYKLAATPPKWAYLVSRKSEDADKGWGIQYDEKDTTTELRVWSGSSEKNKFQIFKTSGMLSTGWNYWTFIYDGSVNQDGTTNQLFHAYLNGEELSTTVGGFPLNYPVVNDENATYDHLVIGGQQNGTGAFNGTVDEARYSKGMRSADWIKAEYDSSLQAVNWNNNKRFVTKGTVSCGTDSLVPVVVWERGTGLPDTILDVSYAYVQFAGTVTYCGAGAEECRVEYQLWVDGEEKPEEWTTLASGLRAGDYFSIPVTGLKQDMLYNFSIRAVNVVDGQERQNYEHAGQFRTHGNMTLGEVDGELFRVGDKFVHRYRAGSWTFTSPDYVTNVEILVVGGGGAGGYKVGGGGGGGGVFHSLSYPVTTSTVYRINVGAGGVAPTDVQTHSDAGNGENSFFALESDAGNPLILVHGGGGGGSYVNDEAIAKGSRGASGGGGTYAFFGGEAESNEVDGVWRTFGHKGGRGNDQLQGGSIGKVAAGGGGGAGRAGLGATFDMWSAGGAGGVGVDSAITGETLFYGAGGGGGYIYRTAVASDGTDNFTKPGGGGSGIGGNAADVRNGTLATSGVANTGAGGGGGSMNTNENTPTPYWQGGDGGDGVVLISYEAHGRDPISDEPRISMTDCLYTDERGYAIIDYRAYWAGIQSQLNDIYVLYSTVSEEDVLAGNGEMVKCAESKIGIGWLKFTPPEKGHTYWVRLVARKDANSFMHSDEVASFEAPAIRINGVTWTESKATEISAPDTSKDYATVLYDVYDTDPDALLYCYWSENRADLEGNAEPSGEGVHFLNVTTDIIENGDTLVSATRFRVSAALGLERNKQYYFRLALANKAGTKFNLSPRIMPLWTAETAYVVYPQALWENHVVTADFMLSPASYDPASVELLALYSGVLSDITAGNAITKESVKSINLGTTDQYPHGDQTLTQFPLSSTETTNYFTRLALKLPDGKYVYSARYQEVNITTHIPTNTILITARAIPQKRCYGDEPPAFDYEVTYAGYTNTIAWDHKPSVVGEPACVTITDDPAQQVPVTSQSPSGQYRIIQNTLALSNPEPFVLTVTEPVVDPETGEQVIDPETHEPMTQTVTTEYEFMFAYARARYTITNAVFSATVADVSAIYTGEPQSTDDLVKTETGVRNSQPVSYQFRGVGDEWGDAFSASYTDVGTHTFEFKASAPNHDDTFGTFTIAITPAPLSATISAEDLNYLAVPQTPQVTTNVTGLVKPDLNPLTCQFRDESGEWQATVPSFTRPGVYNLYFRVSAPNHETFTTNCTFTIEEWDYRVNMDGKEGFAVPINISDPMWLMEVTGKDAAYFADNTDNNRYKILDSVCANGLKLWQNYMIGRTELDKKLVAAVRQSGDRVNENAFAVYFPNVSVLRNTGLNVAFRLDRKLKGESEFTKGELSDKYEMSVPLGPGDPTGLYVFNIVLTPTNNAATGEAMYGGGEAVLTSIATVGVIRASSALTNTVTVAPWRSMTIGTEEIVDVSVSDVVNPNSGIADDDMILSYNAVTSNFNVWAKSSAKGDEWKPLTTVTKNGISVEAAESSSFAPGKAFWLVRNAPGDYIYLVGRYTGQDYVFDLAGGTAAAPGFTLVANPTMYDIDLNDLVFVDGEGNAAEPALGDRIVTQDIAGKQTIYFRHGTTGKWGRNVPTKVGNRTKQVWTEGGAIPSGTGFWYNRTAAGDLAIKFGGAK